MASPIIAKELQAAIRTALGEARRMRHEYLTLEHLLLALLDDDTTAELLRQRGCDLQQIRAELVKGLAEVPQADVPEPQQTIAVERVLQRAAFHALSTDTKLMKGLDVLVAMLREEHSAAVELLTSAGITRLGVLEQLSPPREWRVDLRELEENELSRRRRELEQKGVRIVDLTVSNPTVTGLSPTGVTLPAADWYEPDPLGLRVAREAIARYANVSPERLVLSASTSEAYAWLFKLLGGEALVPAPCYPLIDHLAELERVPVRSYPLRYDGRWCTDSPLVAAAASERTKMVIAISPGNPTGSYLAPHEAEALAQLCAERGWALVIDEVFAEPSRSLAREWPCLTFTLGGLSKACGLPQLKLAWTSVHGPGAEAALERLAFIADTYLSVSAPVQLAAGALLEQHAAPFRARVAERCAINRAALKGLPSDWQLLGAEGGWCAVIRVPEDLDEETRCLELLERGLAVHPGYFYDFPSGAHLVLSLLPKPEDFAEGLSRFRAG